MDLFQVGEDESITFDLGDHAQIEVSIGSRNDTGHMQFSTLHPNSFVPSVFCPDLVCLHSFYNPILSETQEGY
jgi:hypothetical protein